MGTDFINIYTNDQTEIIVDELADVVGADSNMFTNLGEELGPDAPQNTYKNKFFLEVNVFNENDAFLFKLNTGKPLLMEEGGQFYLGDYHLHDNVYMKGIKHKIQPHATLIKVRNSQIDIFPLRKQAGTPSSGLTEYCIKLSQIFEVMKRLPDVDLQKNTKYKITHAVMKDVLLAAGGRMAGVE